MVPTPAVALCTIAVSAAWAQQLAGEKLAVEASEAWLALVDEGKDAESWEAGASLFRGAVTKENWIKLVEGTRKPLGKLIARTFAVSRRMSSVLGGPDSRYITVRYKTVFENKAEAVETITPMLDKDDTWRVAGCYIK